MEAHILMMFPLFLDNCGSFLFETILRLCVYVCLRLMGPSQHNCHFAPLLQVLHTGELAALTDASS